MRFAQGQAGIDDTVSSATAGKWFVSDLGNSPYVAELWQHVRWVRKLFYQVWEPDDFAGGKPGRESAVVIKLPRLAFLVRAALNAMAEPAAQAR